MDGAKSVADTAGLINNERGRQAFWLGRSASEGMRGPARIANPGGSRS